MRIAFILPGLHTVNRGAEVVFRALGTQLQALGHDVTLIGSGEPGSDEYRYLRAPLISRRRFERWPAVPPLRTPFRYEELTWIPGLLRRYRPEDHDVAVTCSYPFSNWVIQRRGGRNRPANVFVTQNGDWPAYDSSRENRWFRCDGLVCTNQAYLDRNRERWPSTLIPNGVDTARFFPGRGDRSSFGLPADRPVVLAVSALDATKRIQEAIAVVSMLDEAVLVVAGDGELRRAVEADARRLLPGRFVRLEVLGERMPELYRCADAMLHMTLSEPFGNVYIEALATGLPVVAHRSAHTEWLIGDHGLLVDTTDFETTAAAVKEALGRPIDPSLHAAVAARFGWSQIATEYTRFFDDVVERHHRRGDNTP